MTAEGEVNIHVTMEARGWHDIVRSQGMPEALRNWKSRGTHSLLDPVVGTSP